MLRVVTALCLCVGLTMAQECCSSEDRHEIQQLWGSVWSVQFTGRRIQVAKSVFHELFQSDPDAKNLFKQVNVDEPDSPEFRAHCIRVVNGLDLVLGLLNDARTLKVQLEHLATQHAQRKGIKKSHFEAMGRAFRKVMPQMVSCFNYDAWDRCFPRVTDAIASELED